LARRGTDAGAFLTVPLDGIYGPGEDALAGAARAGLSGAGLFQGRDGVELAGLGEVARFTARGPGRFAEIAERATRWLRAVDDGAPGVVQDPLGGTPGSEVDAPRPVALGGFAFAPGAGDDAPWSGFGDAIVVVPRWLHRRRLRRSGEAGSENGTGAAPATLSLLVGPGEAGDRRLARRWLDQAAVLLAALSVPPASPRPRRAAPSSPSAVIEPVDEAEWRSRIQDILRAIRSGAFEKIVAARRSELRAAGEDAALPPADEVLRLLRDRYPSCTRFAFRPARPGVAMGERQAPIFLGATPERLVSRRGLAVETEALAGSRPAGLDEDALLASAKDAAEHAPVVRIIRERLAPFCAHLGVADAPELERLPNVVHIRTDLRGILARPAHVLELAGALHPTPAVGGVPGDAAVDWITRREPHPRGWYAAPFGWFDARGDGELVVALRSGLLADRRRAFLYAGGGIVEGSDPAAELAETELKLAPMRTALLGPGADGSAVASAGGGRSAGVASSASSDRLAAG
jgi:isochorismate synthase